MKKLRYLFTAFGLPLFLTVCIQAQDDFLWVQDGTGKLGSSNNTIKIILANENELGGFQFLLKYDNSVLSLDTILALNRLTEMDLYYNELTPGNIEVVTVELGGHTIAPGIGAELQIEMKVSGVIAPQVTPLELTDVVLSGIGGNSLPVVSGNGYFFIEVNNVLRIENGFSPVSVDLYNDIAVGGVQFNCSFNSDVISLDTIFATSRSGSMAINYNEIQSGEVTVLLSSFNQDSILAGEGGILEFIFQEKDTISQANPIYLNDVTLSNTLGGTIDVEYFDGNYFTIPQWLKLEMILQVYPGDTDNNGEVNELDILPIGIYFLQAGIPRTFTTFYWTSYETVSWDISPPTYADANGDGVVDEKDVIAIGVNWGNTHSNTLASFAIDPNDSELLQQHKDAFKRIYNSLSGESEAVLSMKTLLRSILDIEIPDVFSLNQNYPNPFNPSTTISFGLPEAQPVTLTVYNIRGQLVVMLVDKKMYDAGTHIVEFDAKQFSSGIYFYRIQTGQWGAIRKMVVVK